MMACDYQGCFECFMRDWCGPSEWITGTDGCSRPWPLDPMERRCMVLNRQSNDRRNKHPDENGPSLEVRRLNACAALPRS